MQLPYNNLFLQILRIVNYAGDKERLNDHFEQLNYVETVANILEKLPPAIQNEIKSSHNIHETLKKYITPEEYLIELNNVSQKSLNDFLNTITHTLNPLQKQQIRDTIAVV